MKPLLFLLILSGLGLSAQAQRLFSEGVITYKVYTDGGDKAIGKYTVYVKGKYIKRVLRLKNGYHTVTIYNGKEGTSATSKQYKAQTYALMLSKKEVEDASKQFQGAKYKFEKNKVKIAGYYAVKGTVTYRNGKTYKIAITHDLRAEDYHLLTMFPKLNGIPLEYEWIMESPV